MGLQEAEIKFLAGIQRNRQQPATRLSHGQTLGSPWVLNSGPSPPPQDVDEAYMNKVELESRLEGLTDEINFLRQIHEEVLSPGLEWAGPSACQYPTLAPRRSTPVVQHTIQQGSDNRRHELTLL